MSQIPAPRSSFASSTASLEMGVREWAMLLFLSLLWGGSFYFVGVAVSALPTLTIVAVRVGLAALFLWAVVLVSGRKVPRDWTVWGAFLIMGLLNNVIPFGFITWGQQSIASGLASILNGATPFFAILVAGFLLKDEPWYLRKLLGVAIGFGGVVVMIGYDGAFSVPTGSEADGLVLLGQIAVLVGALSYAFAGVFGRRFKAMNVDPLVTAAGQVTGSSLFLIPMALWVDQPLGFALPSWGVIWALVGLAGASTALAYILYFSLLARAGATNLLLVTLLIPIWAIFLGWAFLGETLGPHHLLGFVVVGLGLLIIDGRLFKLFSCRS